MVEAGHSFWGEYDLGVDDKGRVVIPGEYRVPLGEEFVLTRGPDHAIWVMPSATWEQIESRLNRDFLKANSSYVQRFLGGRTYVKPDSAHRLLIPRHLREWAKISQDEAAVIVGQGPKLEIWCKSVWRSFMEGTTSAVLFGALQEAGISLDS